MKTVCYWLVGANNKSQAPAVAFDLHGEDGTIIKSDSHVLRSDCDALREAQLYATGFAQRNGAQRLSYDQDSTDCFADC